MQLQRKRILVTGADGFIGSHLAEELARTGHDVRAFVYYNSFNTNGWLDASPPALRGNIEIVAGDIRDPHGVRSATQGCDVVMHLAALIAIPFSYRAPDAFVDTNIKGTLNVLQAARDLGCERVVCTSTSEVYGSAQYVPMDEKHPLVGQSPYAATKIGADQLALSFHRSFDTPVSLIRPFNAYGPRQSARAVIPTVIAQIAARAKTIQLGATAPTRDFTYVRDTVRAFASVAQCDAAIGRVLNIGSDFEISIGDLTELIAETMDREIQVTLDEQRMRPESSEVDRLFCDSALARELTGWQPEFEGLAGLRRGIAETVAWFTEPANLARYKPHAYNL